MISLKESWGRYLDIDSDGICYRTYPGAHPSKGSYFTRGSSHDEYATYSEDSTTYQRIMLRLLRKWRTAATMVPEPHIRIQNGTSPIGALFFGTTTHAAYEAMDRLAEDGVSIDTMRIRAFPFGRAVLKFIDDHQVLFVIEQNRDGQLRTLLLTENNLPPEKLVSIVNFDGLPITADYITSRLNEELEKRAFTPTTSDASAGGNQ